MNWFCKDFKKCATEISNYEKRNDATNLLTK